jgi:hypothetical protein
MSVLELPSGAELSLSGLYRQVSHLTQADVQFVFSAPAAIKFRKPLGEMLGRAFASLYNRRRALRTRSQVDFWTVKSGAFKEKFTQTAVSARVSGVDTDRLIQRAEDLARTSKMHCYPSPHLVCGAYVFGEVLNGWTPVGYHAPPPDESDKMEMVDAGTDTWIYQPGYKWDADAKRFVKDASYNNR